CSNRGKGHSCRPGQRDIAIADGTAGDDSHDFARSVCFRCGDCCAHLLVFGIVQLQRLYHDLPAPRSAAATRHAPAEAAKAAPTAAAEATASAAIPIVVRGCACCSAEHFPQDDIANCTAHAAAAPSP